jgi:hypothetical protein
MKTAVASDVQSVIITLTMNRTVTLMKEHLSLNAGLMAWMHKEVSHEP